MTTSMTEMLRRPFREPLAAKVPEVTLVFWVVTILTTAGGPSRTTCRSGAS